MWYLDGMAVLNAIDLRVYRILLLRVPETSCVWNYVFGENDFRHDSPDSHVVHFSSFHLQLDGLDFVPSNSFRLFRRSFYMSSSNFALVDRFEISVMSRSRIVEFDVSRPHALIVILERSGSVPVMRSCSPWIHVSRFLDYRDPVYGCITDDEALGIVLFVESLPSEVSLIVVSCALGASRSPAVASAICRRYGIDDTRFYDPANYFPNLLVLERVSSAFGRTDVSGSRLT